MVMINAPMVGAVHMIDSLPGGETLLSDFNDAINEGEFIVRKI